MKLSWTSLKISIAGARLSHLVQKDRIWDHGSMAEQARIIFRLVQKAIACGDIESLRKHCSGFFFEKIIREGEQRGSKIYMPGEPVIKELAIVEVQPGKSNKPDMFSALIKGVSKNNATNEFKVHCSFVRQGDWWLLDEVN